MSQPLPSASKQYLSFFLAGEEYALGILQVREILEHNTVTRLPGAPVWVRGIFNLRGSVVPVVDLAVKLGMPPPSVTRWSCIVVVEVTRGREQWVVGLLVDSIGQVMELGPGDVVAPPSFGTPVHMDCLEGVSQVSERKFVLLLDIDRVLSSQEILQANALPAPADAPAEPPAPEASPTDSSGTT